MIMYFHVKPGDTILFDGWVPKSTGAMIGACIGLLLLGMAERWLAACRAGMEGHWRSRALIAHANALNTLPRKSTASSSSSSSPEQSIKTGGFMRRVPPFIPAHDLTRGVVFAAQSALSFALMLIVMTFNVGFILSIVVGLGIGEALFGRYIVAAGGVGFGQDHAH
ncbi:Ctr copper transporter [Pterulicium gracile]|uniref:Copper transport protein n=1 Tax=Pterulicium gracile TaxID=1884261 RepID=A0A5C3Q9I7_9AGAR|nr:Ctr copper transporter [Pterula gracilis]